MSRSTPYHHGDLRNALVAASAELAESGGPEAVTVRAAARAVGVTATAAYRHFAGRDELLAAARQRAQEELFTSMQRALESVPPLDDPIEQAVRTLHATGRGYIDFAITERGMFKTAFCALEPNADMRVSAPGFQMLSVALDTLVDVGYLAPADRPGAELVAWSGVHGLAMLLIDGALGDLGTAEREYIVERTVTTLARGFGTGPNATAEVATSALQPGRRSGRSRSTTSRWPG